MKDLIGNQKARVKPLAIIVVITIIIAIGVFIYLNPEITGSKPYWETKTEFGTWQDEITVEFKDGSTKSFKIIENLLTVYHAGEPITKITISLSAKIEGIGYTGAELDCEDFGYSYIVKNYRTDETVYSSTGTTTNNNFQIPLGETRLLTQTDIYASFFDDQPDLFPDAIYSIQFTVEGMVRYRGYPNGEEWKTAPLVPDRVIGIDLQRDTSSDGSLSTIITLY